MGEAKSYPVIWSGILEPKHHRNIGPAIWTFAVLVDWSTDQNGNRTARVRGGLPVSAREIAERLGISIPTVYAHLLRLESHNYIVWKRTPRDPSGGYVTVRKNKKVWLRYSEFQVEGEPPIQKSEQSIQNPDKPIQNSEYIYIEEDTTETQQYFRATLQTLAKIPKFRKDETANLLLVRNLEEDYPQVDQQQVAHSLWRKVTEGGYTAKNLVNAYRNWVEGAARRGHSLKPERPATVECPDCGKPARVDGGEALCANCRQKWRVA